MPAARPARNALHDPMQARGRRFLLLLCAVAALHAMLWRTAVAPLGSGAPRQAGTRAAPQIVLLAPRAAAPVRAGGVPAAPAATAPQPSPPQDSRIAAARSGRAERPEPVSPAPKDATDAAPLSESLGDGRAGDLARNDRDRPAPAAEGDAGDGATGTPPPVYATQMPPSVSLTYRVTRGASQGQGALEWQAEGDRFELGLTAHVAGRGAVDWHSRGGFDGAGLAPVRLVERRRGKDTTAVNFQREKGLITFSASTRAVPLLPGAQDRLGWLLQLAAVLRAGASPGASPGSAAGVSTSSGRPGEAIEMMVAGTRGSVDRWRFHVVDREPLQLQDRTWQAVHLLREPQRPYDTRVEVWLAPALGHLPIGWRLATVPGDEELAFWLEDTPPAGP